MINFDTEMIVYSQQIATELRRRGFKIKRTEINHRYPQYDVYIFEKSNILHDEFEDILESRGHRKGVDIYYGYREQYNIKENDVGNEEEKEDCTVHQAVQTTVTGCGTETRRKLRLCLNPFRRHNCNVEP